MRPWQILGVVIVTVVVWFAPAAIANLRRCRSTNDICVLNLFGIATALVWVATDIAAYLTVALWLALLVWSFKGKRKA
jgi:hypothetical protein